MSLNLFIHLGPLKLRLTRETAREPYICVYKGHSIIMPFLVQDYFETGLQPVLFNKRRGLSKC